MGSEMEITLWKKNWKLSKLIVFSEQLLSQIYVVRRQMIQIKRTRGNGCHKTVQHFFGKTKKINLKKDKKNTTTSIKQVFSISRASSEQTTRD